MRHAMEASTMASDFVRSVMRGMEAFSEAKAIPRAEN